MGKIFTLLVLAALVYLIFRGFFRAKVKPPGPPPSPRAPGGEDMVACARCGVNLPSSEARRDGERWVCDKYPDCR